MTDVGPIELGPRAERRMDSLTDLLNVIARQAEYIEELEAELDERMVTVEIKVEDPKWQILRNLHVSEDEIDRLKEEEQMTEDEPPVEIDWGQTDVVADQVRAAAPKLVLARPAEVVDPEPPPETPAPRKRAAKKVNPPRAGRPATGHRIPAGGDDDNPFANGAIPGVSAEAQVVLNQPLKQTRPRQRSQHDIPVEQWKRDGAGRRVPIETPEES